MKKVIAGNHAVSYGAMLSRCEVIAAYPITPQTQIVELLSEMCADKKIDARFIKVESEHSAMAACIGASAAGVRAFTATSAQGLALMHELLHWAAGARLPVVLANVNRAMASPWSIWTDQNDSLSQRDTGWLQFYCESNQEVLDTTIQAFKISEQVMLPSMLVLDAFVLSHTFEPVDIPAQELVDSYLPSYKAPLKIDTSDPHAYGGLATPEVYFELRYKMQKAMEDSLSVVKEAGLQFREIFGREYRLVEPFLCEDADTVVVTSGTVSSTCRHTIRQLRSEGHKVGMLKIRVFRPFPAEEIRKNLAGCKKVAVIDRNISFGHCGIFASEIKSILYGNGSKPVFPFVAGLGGRDITPQTIREIVESTEKDETPKEDVIWVGLKT
jgi:pyruvate/2-oxoacid:ferredoxin oxidoreductase alpha subunit